LSLRVVAVVEREMPQRITEEVAVREVTAHRLAVKVLVAAHLQKP